MSLILTAVLLAKLPLVVRTYNTVGLSPATLERAQVSAGAALAAIGIESIWRPCHASDCVSALDPDELAVRLVTATPLSAPGSLGFAAVDVGRRAGTLATVYVDRVEALASQAGVDPGMLLGRAIAHEIGHLMLGTTNHARFGLMRAAWKTDELRREMPLDWLFSAEQGAEIRARLTGRTDSIRLPQSIVADARLPAGRRVRYDRDRGEPGMEDSRSADDRLLDETLEETFPASDAPANTVETGTRVGPVPLSSSITDNREASQFELVVDGETSVLKYERQPTSLVLVHTEVPPSLRGHHLGDALVKAALDSARADGLKIVAVCPFVRAYLRKHPHGGGTPQADNR